MLPSVSVQDPYEYSRSANPTRGVFEKCIAAVEGAKHGKLKPWDASDLSCCHLYMYIAVICDHPINWGRVIGVMETPVVCYT